MNYQRFMSLKEGDVILCVEAPEDCFSEGQQYLVHKNVVMDQVWVQCNDGYHIINPGSRHYFVFLETSQNSSDGTEDFFCE